MIIPNKFAFIIVDVLSCHVLPTLTSSSPCCLQPLLSAHIEAQQLSLTAIKWLVAKTTFIWLCWLHRIQRWTGEAGDMSAKCDKMTNPPPTTGKYFVIRSVWCPELILEVNSGNKAPGAPVTTSQPVPVTSYRWQPGDHQLWYLNSETGAICSRLNGYCLDIDGTTGNFMCAIYPRIHPQNINYRWLSSSSWTSAVPLNTLNYLACFAT
jgi:hypothetical protein